MKRHFLSSSVRASSLAVMIALAVGAVPVQAGSVDLDGDGIPNVVDPDIDNDGIPNALDRNVDGGIAKTGPYAGKYIGDHLDNDNPAERDIDDDGLADDSLGEYDIDGDGKRDDDELETDIDGDRRNDDSAGEMDIDGDGRADDDDGEYDIDGDGLDDDDEGETDIDGDGRSDDDDDDIDGDHRFNADSAEDDTDGDSLKDEDASEQNDDGDSRWDREDEDDDNDGDFDEDDLDHRAQDDELEVEASLTAQPAAPKGSRARVKIQRMATGKIEFEVKVRDLPAGFYEVVVNEVVLGLLEMERDDDDDRTEGEVEFETNPNKPKELPLPWDPSGLPVSLRRGGVDYYAGTVPTTPPVGDGAGGLVFQVLSLTRTVKAPAAASVRAEVEFGFGQAKELEIELQGLAAGVYEILIGEAVRGSVELNGVGARGELSFKLDPDDADEWLLDFPVAGAPIAVVSRGVTYFFGTLPVAELGGGGDPDPDGTGGGAPVVSGLTAAVGLSAEAKAKVGVRFGPLGPVGFEVEVEGVAPGEYELAVAGVGRGVVAVTDQGGRLRFKLVPEADGERLLDFVMAGQELVIRQGENLFFRGVSPVAGR